MLFHKDEMAFFWIENLQCMSKYVKEEEDLFGDVVIMVSRSFDHKTNEIVKNPILLNLQDASNIKKLNKWIMTAISDIEKVFSERTIYTIMDEKMFAVILLRVGGRPMSDEDYEEMQTDDR